MLEDFDSEACFANLPPAERAALELEARLIAGEPHAKLPPASRSSGRRDPTSGPADHDISD
jgi:hypothetical protein